jgi:hypothetical protein
MLTLLLPVSAVVPSLLLSGRGLRVFRAPVVPGTPPVWTLTPAPLKKDHVFVP